MHFTLWTLGLYCLLGLVSSRSARSNEENRQSKNRFIGHAKKAEPGEFPAVGAIFSDVHGRRKLLCSGTLITPSHVLTSARCITNMEPTTLSVAFTTTVMGDASETDRKVKNFFLHGDFHAGSPGSYLALVNNIAIMVLSSPITTIPVTKLPRDSLRTLTIMEPTGNITKTKLPITQEEVKSKSQALETRTFSSYAYEPGVIVGWGLYHLNYMTNVIPNPPELAKANVTILDTPNHDIGIASFNATTMLRTLSAFARQGHDNDCGGPLYVKDVQVGIIGHDLDLFFIKVEHNRHVTTYTRVDAYLDWIAKIVTSNPE